MTHVAYIGLGANLEDPLIRCQEAIGRIDETRDCTVSAVSPFFKTEPVGVEGQKWYVNGVIRVDTRFQPRSLLACLLWIETDMGRKRQTRWGPRVIDLDILLFGNEIVEEKNITIPHPLMHKRRFVLMPLIRLAPHLMHPVLEKTMTELLREIPQDDQAVKEMGG